MSYVFIKKMSDYCTWSVKWFVAHLVVMRYVGIHPVGFLRNTYHLVDRWGHRLRGFRWFTPAVVRHVSSSQLSALLLQLILEADVGVVSCARCGRRVRGLGFPRCHPSTGPPGR